MVNGFLKTMTTNSSLLMDELRDFKKFIACGV